MALIGAFLLGGLIIGVFAFSKAKRDSGYERLQAEVPTISLSGQPSTLRNWYVAYIRNGKVHYEICASEETQAIIDSQPKDAPVAYGTLDRVEVFRTPDALLKSRWNRL